LFTVAVPKVENGCGNSDGNCIGNSLRTLWEPFENSMGKLRELFGNSTRTLWELHWNAISIHCIYCTNIAYYTILYIPYIVRYSTHILYNIILTYYTLQWEVNCLSQHSSCILSIRFSLDNDYGTIISKVGTMLGTLMQHFLLKHCFWPPKCFSFPQTLFIG
jgi:hypothetical protein